MKKALGAVVLAALLAAACSGDRGDDPTEAAAEGDTTTTAAPAGDGEPDVEAFGDLSSPCGEAAEANTDAGTEQGVTADSVVIGYGDDAGFPTSPGLSHEASDAIEAFVAWCNEQGGIHGRQIDARYYDAKITEIGNAITAACGEVFMLVGEAWAFDSGQEQTRLGCGLPAVPTYSVSADFANAPLMHVGVPNPIDMTTGAWFDQLATAFPEAVKKASVMFGNFTATQDSKDKFVAGASQFGWEFLPCPQEYAIGGEPSWAPFVQRLQECGAEIVAFSGQAYPNLQNLLDAAAQAEYRPIWVTDSNSYLQSFADWNTAGNGDDVYIRLSFTPFEQADLNPAVQQYVDIVEADGGDVSQLGMQATSSFLLWATAASSCGTELTRECVMSELAGVTSWTGGGLHAETSPGENLPPACGMVVKLDGTQWVQAFPEEEGEMDCDPSYRVTITGRVVDAAELGPDRISRKHTG